MTLYILTMWTLNLWKKNNLKEGFLGHKEIQHSF